MGPLTREPTKTSIHRNVDTLMAFPSVVYIPEEGSLVSCPLCRKTFGLPRFGETLFFQSWQLSLSVRWNLEIPERNLIECFDVFMPFLILNSISWMDVLSDNIIVYNFIIFDFKYVSSIKLRSLQNHFLYRRIENFNYFEILRDSLILNFEEQYFNIYLYHWRLMH